jgi:hypothetical protein
MTGALLLGIGLVHWALGWVPPEHMRRAMFRRGVAGLGILLCLLPVGLAGVPLAEGLFVSDAGMFALLLLLATNWLLCRHAESDRPWEEMPALVFRPVAALAALLALSWLLAVLLDRALYLWHRPETLLGVPGFAVGMSFFYPNILLHRARLLLFSEYSTWLIPSPLWFGILGAEAAFPGLGLTVAGQTVEKAFRAWRRTRTRAPVAAGTPSYKRLVRLGLGLALLTSLAWSGWRVKPLDGPVTRALGWEFGRFMLLLVVVIAILGRITPLRDWGRRGSVTGGGSSESAPVQD